MWVRVVIDWVESSRIESNRIEVAPEGRDDNRQPDPIDRPSRLTDLALERVARRLLGEALQLLVERLAHAFGLV